MNCANHPDRERSAFCQNCGKPVCGECVRNVGSSTFCEPCMTTRAGATAPPSSFPYPGYPYPGNPQPGPVGYPPAVPPASTGEPSPGLAALLGFIPGVGAMYNGQYAKGIVHLIVFAVLVSLTSDVNLIFLLFVFGWEFYMAIEAHHTACARRDGTPLPNPFGLNDLSERLGFGKAWPGSTPNATPTNAMPYTPPASPAPDARPAVGGDTFFHQAADGSQTYSAPSVPPVSPVPPMAAPCDIPVPYYRRFPSGAVWLILLGVFFLVGDTGFFHIFHHPVFWPVFLIAVGVWVFVHKMIVTGPGLENDGTEFYRWRFARAVRSSFWVVLVGVLWLLDVLGILSWSRSWPLYLIAWGVMLLFKRTLYSGYGIAGTGSGGNGASPGASGSAPASGSEALASEASHDASGSDSGNSVHNDPEGR
jgi:TM2 domain-containing membrane protein YozV